MNENRYLPLAITVALILVGKGLIALLNALVR